MGIHRFVLCLFLTAWMMISCRAQSITESPIPVRLSGGINSSDGRVELYYNNSWGTICDDSWDRHDAEVICRMLGYITADDAPIAATYGEGNGDIWLDEVECYGDEVNIADCRHGGFGNHDCGHQEDAGVICSNSTDVFRDVFPVCPESCNMSSLQFYCYCDSICADLGDCCRDYNRTTQRMDTSKQRVIPPLENWSCLGIAMESSFEYWLLVSRCPADFADDVLRQRCESEFRNGDTIVTDGSGAFFTNADCAFCHGISESSLLTNYGTFELCDDEHDQSGSELTATYCFREAFLNRTLSSTILRARLCASDYNDVIMRCPNSANVSAHVAKKCDTFSAAIWIDGQGYKNKYCAVCHDALLNDKVDNIPMCTQFETTSFSDSEVPHDVPFMLADPFIPDRPNGAITVCPSGIVYDSSRCIPEDTEWPACEQIVTSYATLSPLPPNICFSSFRDFSMKTNTFEDIKTNSVTETFDVYTFGNFLREDLENIIQTSINNLNTAVCTEIQITLSETCVVEFTTSSNCTEEWFVDSPNLFQPVAINGTNYVVYNNTYVSPVRWSNSTIYSRAPNDTFVVSREIRVCGHRENVMICPMLLIEDFQIITEGNITFILFSNSYINPEHYVIFPNGSAVICWTSTSQLRFSRAQIITGHVAFGISTIALLATLVTYLILAPLRNLQGWAIINFVSALFCAQLFLEYFATYMSPWPTMCQIVAVLSHFFFLASFSWMTVLAWTISRGFSSAKVTAPDQSDMTRRLLRYSVFGWLLPCLFVTVCLFVHFWGRDKFTFRYGGSSCWIMTFVDNIIVFLVPMSVSLLANAVLFVMTIRGVRSSKEASKILNRDKRKETKQELVIYIKISSLMGFGWAFGYISAAAGTPALYYVFYFINAAQGVLIFWSFAANPRVRKMWRDRRRHRAERSTNSKQVYRTVLSSSTSTKSTSV